MQDLVIMLLAALAGAMAVGALVAGFQRARRGEEIERLKRWR